MRIAVWHNLPSGGGKRALYYHVRGLVERGHVVESWCPSTADPTYLPLGLLVSEHLDPVTWPEVGRRRVGSASLAQAINVLRRLRAMDQHCQRCAHEMTDGGFDILFANACTFFRSPSIARHLDLPSALYLQEPYRPLYEALPQLPWIALSPESGSSHYSPTFLRRWIADWITVHALRVQAREELRNAQAFRSILVNSLFSRESVLRAYGIPAQLCYLGVDTDLFVDRHEHRQGFVVGIGSFTPEKNIDFIIRAVAQVRHHPRRLVWIGNIGHPPYVQNLAALASRLGVLFEPKLRISDAEIVRVLNRATLMAYAPRLEPFGLAPLEANACGLPVVAVAEGGVRETVVHGVNGLVSEPDPRSLAAAIQRLLDDDPYARRLGANGRALVSARWSLEAAVDRLELRLARTIRGTSAPDPFASDGNVTERRPPAGADPSLRGQR
jgi:glycosyltransferase involved in cell wall biosynthesis